MRGRINTERGELVVTEIRASRKGLDLESFHVILYMAQQVFNERSK